MFKSRIEAGNLLAEKIAKDLGQLTSKAVILGIPRGGVIVAKQIADSLACFLDVIVVKKIGAPNQPERAIGAVGETNGSKYIDQRLVDDVKASKDYLNSEIIKMRQEIKRREQLYRQNKPPLDLKNKIVIVTDDGAATGATVIAAVREVWNNQPKKVVIALPVLSKDILAKLEKEADEVLYLDTPWPFFAVGQFYQQFPQITDEEVIGALL